MLGLEKTGYGPQRSVSRSPLCPSLPQPVSTHNQPHLNSKCKSLPGLLAIPVAQDGVAAMEMASQTGGHPDVEGSCT